MAGGQSQQEIEAWLAGRLSELTGSTDPIDVDAPISRYGIDSAKVAEVAAELEAWLGKRADDELLADDPSIRSLAKHLA